FRAETPMDTLLQVLADDPVPPCRLQPKVPRDMETICLKCLHKEPGTRYASAQDLAEELRRYLSGQPIRARRMGVLGRVVLWSWRKPTLALAAVLALTTLVAVVVLTIVYAFAQQQSRSADQLRHEQVQTRAALAEAEKYRLQAEGLST